MTSQPAPRNRTFSLSIPVISLVPLLLSCGLPRAAQGQDTLLPAEGFRAVQLAGIEPVDLPSPFAASSPANPDDTLPEAPGWQSSSQTSPQNPAQNAGQTSGLSASTPPAVPGHHPVAPIRTKYVPAGYTARPLTAHDKLLVAAGDLYSVENFAAILIASGYEQVLNNQPNFGTDRGAYGERLGAAAIRESTQGFFSDAVFSSLLHEDPRYYQKGPATISVPGPGTRLRARW